MQARADTSAREALLAAYTRAGRPWSAHLDLTYRCDLACQHCYLDDRQRWPELTTAEWRAVLGQLADLGVLRLQWSGGELLLRRDLDELLEIAQQRGFVSSLRSHAGLVTDDRAARWRAAGIEKVTTSVYSLDPARHDAFTRRPGSWQATLDGVRRLRAQNLAVGVGVVLQADTVEEIPALFGFFSDLGCDTEFSTSVYRDHLARPHLDLLDLTSAQRQRAHELIGRVQPEAYAPHTPVAQRGEDGACGAGRSYLYISPDGAVWPCSMFPMALGQLREHSLAEIWEHSPQRQAIVEWKNRHRTECMGCAGSGNCFYCPGEAYKHTGDFRIAPDHFHARTRDILRGREAAGHAGLSPAQWATIPGGDAKGPRPQRFVFPIYRPSKSGGARVVQAPKP